MFVLLFRQYNTKYYYEVGLDHTKRQFWFHTPPEIGPDVPYTFGVMGKLKLIDIVKYIYTDGVYC
jgi:hypothetical protein